MRKYPNPNQLRQARDREFLIAYRAVVSQKMKAGEDFTRREAVREVLKNYKPRFYVSYKRAYDVLPRLIYRGEEIAQKTNQRELWLDLAQKVKACMEKYTTLSLPQALAHVLAGGRAERFYITENYALHLLPVIVERTRVVAKHRIQKLRENTLPAA